jgi:sugar phosphate isomerase/epimerase
MIMKMNQIAAQLFTIRDFIRDEQGFDESMKKLSEIGYTAVQLSGLGFNNPEIIKKTCDTYGIKIVVTHISWDRLTKDFDSVVREHKYYNCEYVGLGHMPGEYQKSTEGMKEFVKDFSQLGRKFKKEGLELIYHNHNFEFEKFDGKVTGLDLFFNETDPEAVGFELDTYWIQAGASNPVDWIYKVKGRMGVVHFKDMSIVNSQQYMAEVGEGNLNWDAIIKACDETGVRWAAVEQDVCQRDPFESLKISFDNLNRML